MENLKGIMPAVVTPFEADGTFKECAFENLLGRLYRTGVHGIYISGQTGEGLLQSPDQREAVMKSAVANSPRGKTVIAHVGAGSTAEAVRLARFAGKAGVHAISSLPPIGNYSFAEIKQYYEALAAASDLPLLIYYFPALAPAIVSADQIKELCRIPNVVGLKFTGHDFFMMSIVKESGATIFSGYDEVLVAGLLMGADGGIGTFYNLVPELFVEIYELSLEKKWDEARRRQKKVNSLIEAAVRYPVFPAIKKLLAWSGLDCGECLPPRRSLTADEETALRDSIGKLDFEGLFPNLNAT
ncbi:MAG TPA: dihydrodipicolinate synthase family protein [Pyrinomonadaceae bacterium]|jgi:N-acetylneuraminate lyase